MVGQLSPRTSAMVRERAGEFGLLTRALRSILVGVSPYDPLTLLSVGVVFALVTLVACIVPARRAVDVDPAVSLKAE